MLIRGMSRAREQGDEGVALLVAIALIAIGTAVMITMTTLVVRENRQTGRDRDRSVSVMTAEGGIDTALAQIQNAAVGSIPCGTSSKTSTNSKPETVVVTTTVTYYDATGAPIPCQAAGGLSSTMYAAQASVKSVAKSTPAGGGMPVQRTMETLVQLKPKYADDLDRAIFGQAGVQFSNNFDLYGQNGPDADVYTNGDFTCTNNEHFRGSVYAQGAINLNGPCTIDVNAWAKTGFSITDSKALVSGDVDVSNGNAYIGAGTIGGKVKAQTITPTSWCDANPNKCVTGTSAAPPPPSVSFPQLSDTSAWTAPVSSGGGGYTIVTNSTGGQYFDNCTDTSSPDNPGNWIATHGNSLSSDTLLQTHCTLTFKSNVKNVTLSKNLAIFASGGIDLEQSLDFASTDSTHHYLYFIQPYGSTCGPAPNNLGIYLGNLVTMEPTISELLYTPCDVHKENQSSTYGQVYAGGTAYIDNKTSSYYVPIPVFGAVVTKVVLWYTADILYKREVLS